MQVSQTQMFIKNLHEHFHLDLPDQFHIIVHSDGGARANCAAAAWIVEATSWQEDSGNWQVQTLSYSATYINTWVSSFTAEALALYQASDFVNIFINKLCASGVVGKRDA